MLLNSFGISLLMIGLRQFDGNGWLPVSASQRDARPHESLVIVRELMDLDRLIPIHVGEPLRRAVAGPQYFDAQDLRRFSQADVLLEG